MPRAYLLQVLTIGIVFVARCAARTATTPTAAMTSTRALTNSAAYCEIRSRCRAICATFDGEILAFE